MDIQVASNFERFLYYYFGEDSERLKSFMVDFAEHGAARLGAAPDTKLFHSIAVNRQQTMAAMSDAKERYGYVLDPHTAVGYAAAQQLGSRDAPLLCIATAHPAKFPEAVAEATGTVPTHPSLDALIGLEQRKSALDADLEAIKNFLATAVSS
jgi:threonine synthase